MMMMVSAAALHILRNLRVGLLCAAEIAAL
jgi:hypothetical protein